MEPTTEIPKCSHCGSSQVYTRLKTNDRHCRLCGKDTPLITGGSDVEAGTKE